MNKSFNLSIEMLGCPKNQVDAEKMLGALDNHWHVENGLGPADAAIIHSCAFIQPAVQETVDYVLKAVELKKEGKISKIIVSGCLAGRYNKDELRHLMPEVDCFMGPNDQHELAGILEKYVRMGEMPACGQKNDEDLSIGKTGKLQTPAADGACFDTGLENTAIRHRMGPAHIAWLKLSDGCSNRCTYCTIPMIRGPLKSRPVESILEEAQKLCTESYTKELILVAQDTGAYGRDSKGGPGLGDLLARLADLTIPRIRLMYVHPEHLDQRTMEIIGSGQPFVPYLDLPIQHASDRVLHAMGRNITSAQMRKVIDQARKTIPDLALRTTVISGFPGETLADHHELMNFIRSVKFDHLGVFKYFAEENTRAARMKNQVSEQSKTARRNTIMKAQSQISTDKLKHFLGDEVKVMVDEVHNDSATARTMFQAPEIDGCVFLSGAAGLEPGDMIVATVTDTYEYDLEAVIKDTDKRHKS